MSPKPLSRELFIQAAEMLWGKQFQLQAAEMLGIARVSVQRYTRKNKPRPIPDKVLEKLADLLVEREKAIGRLIPKVMP